MRAETETCEEGVTRQGEFVICGKLAVGYRIDPTDTRTSYPVCPYHSRGQMLPITTVMAIAWTVGHDQTCTHSCKTYEGLGEKCRNPYLENS